MFQGNPSKSRWGGPIKKTVNLMVALEEKWADY